MEILADSNRANKKAEKAQKPCFWHENATLLVHTVAAKRTILCVLCGSVNDY